MSMTLSKKIMGAIVAVALCFGMVPAMALAFPQEAQAATLAPAKIAQKSTATKSATYTLATKAKKAKKTSLTTAYKNGDLKLIVNTYKYVKNPKYNAKTDSEYNKYVRKSLTDYTGKAKKPVVELYVKNEKSTKKYTDKTENPYYTEDRTFTGYTKLKGVTITGKETKKQLAKKTKGKAFTVKYENNKALGTAQITIKGVNKYSGTLYQAFSIDLAEMKTVKAKAAKKGQLKVSWSKVKGAKGYLESVYPTYPESATSNYYSDGASKSIIVSAKKKSTVLKGLTSSKYYRVTVTAFADCDKTSYKTTNRDYAGWNEKTGKSIYKLYTNSHQSYAHTATSSTSADKAVKVK